MDINNYYDEVPVPSLDSATYAADMQDMVDKINENFRRLGSAAWLKGDRGASAESNEELLFDENENTTDLGRAVFATIYKDYGIEDVQDSNLDTYSSIRNFVSGIEGTATTSFDNITTDSTVTVLGIYEPGEDIEYTLEEGWFAGPWFFNDSRCDVLDQMTEAELQRFSDMSCVLYGSYDCENWSIDSYYIMPTFYWNSDSNMFCWKIDGRTTNVTAQGVKGEKGDNANSYVFLGGDIDYSPNPTELNVTLNNVWWKGDDETWGWKSVNSLTDDEKAALTGCLGLVWFRRAYVEPTNDEEHYTPTFTMGIIQNAENMYIEYNEGGGTDIQFDFAQIMSIMSLKNSLSNITAGRAIPQTNDVLRGLFLPIEYTDNTGTPHIEQTNKYHEMWSTLDGSGDLNIGVVSDVDNPDADEDTTANINVYYKNFNTDTSKTRIEAGDVTTGSADAGEIDLCAENDVDIIAGNMVDIDTPLVEMGNDDNKSNAVVHGELNITGSETNKVEIYQQPSEINPSDLSFAVIARPKRIKFNKTNSGDITWFNTITTFEFIFGYCGYKDKITAASGDTLQDYRSMPVMYNAQKVEIDFYANADNNPETKHTTIEGQDVAITFTPVRTTLFNRPDGTGSGTEVKTDYVDIPDIRIKRGNYSVVLSYSSYINDFQVTGWKYLSLLPIQTRYRYDSTNLFYQCIQDDSIKYSQYALLQFFTDDLTRTQYLSTTIISKKIGSFGDYQIWDNNINGKCDRYTYTTGVERYLSNNGSIYTFSYQDYSANVFVTRYTSSSSFEILSCTVNGDTASRSWKITFEDNSDLYGYNTLDMRILPKGIVGYNVNNYIKDPRLTDTKCYNGGMICDQYIIESSITMKTSTQNLQQLIDAERESYIHITTPNEDDHYLLPDVETDNP